METVQLWKSLGIQLNPLEDATLPFNVLSFAIDHPSLVSTLSPPEQVQVASLKRVCCSVHFSSLLSSHESAVPAADGVESVAAANNEWIEDFEA